MVPSWIGPYRVIRLLGEGGMGSVYEGVHTDIERRVALKVLHPEFVRDPEVVQRFFNEARAVNRIEHPNIVQISEFGQAQDGSAYLVMEFLRGQTLSARLAALGATKERMPASIAVHLACQLADALAAAHSKGIIHRDLKPANIMLTDDSLAPGGVRVKLLDFGIAKLLHGPGGGGKVTKTGAVMGTPQYMSPEQCRGASAVDAKTDVYALGVILFEMLAGRPPFIADDVVGYVGQHVFVAPPPLESVAPDVTAGLSSLVHMLLAKDKDVRPAMHEVKTSLECLGLGLGHVSKLAGLTGPSSQAEPSKNPSTLGASLGQTVRSKPVRLWVLVAGVFVCGLVASGGVYWRSPRRNLSSSAAQAPQVQPSEVSTRQARTVIEGAASDSAIRPVDKALDLGPKNRNDALETAASKTLDVEKSQTAKPTTKTIINPTAAAGLRSPPKTSRSPSQKANTSIDDAKLQTKDTAPVSPAKTKTMYVD